MASALTVVFLATIGTVPLAQFGVGPAPIEAVREFGRGLVDARGVAGIDGLAAENRLVLAALDRFETRLDDEAILRHYLLPPVQVVLSGVLGAGNEQAYIGRGGWLLYRPDVDYVVGPGFLEAQVMERRRRGGNAWETAPRPDPMPAIVRLARDLEERGIELLVMPTPVKPMILPAALVWRHTPAVPLQNPSWPGFVEALEEEGIDVLDVGRWMAEMPSSEEALFLTTDTHWTPRAMEEVAKRLAREISDRLPGATVESTALSRNTVAIEGTGDIASMLLLPDAQQLFPRQRVTVAVVTTADGDLWRPDPSAEVLLLGDSFTNVFSDPSLGWGQGAGLAEQLSYILARPIDRIALNAGGSSASRRALVDALVEDPDRLSAKKIVVYQFAARELSYGDWPVLILPE